MSLDGFCRPLDDVAVDVSAPSHVVAQLAGPAGLALDVFRQLLERVGVVVVDADGSAAGDADLVVLVEPTAEHWHAARATRLSIVLVHGEEADDSEVIDSVLAGADAVVHCDTEAATVLAVIEQVSHGGSVLEPVQMRAVAGLARAAGSQPAVVLSRRETEILGSIADGRAVKQTARELGISPKTVENLQGRLFRKLGARNRSQAVARAHALRLL